MYPPLATSGVLSGSFQRHRASFQVIPASFRRHSGSGEYPGHTPWAPRATPRGHPVREPAPIGRAKGHRHPQQPRLDGNMKRILQSVCTAAGLRTYFARSLCFRRLRAMFLQSVKVQELVPPVGGKVQKTQKSKALTKRLKDKLN